MEMRGWERTIAAISKLLKVFACFWGVFVVELDDYFAHCRLEGDVGCHFEVDEGLCAGGCCLCGWRNWLSENQVQSSKIWFGTLTQ